MKFMTLLAAGLLPMIALAAPAADANPIAVGDANPIPAPEPVEVAKPDVPPTSPVDARDLFKRSTQYCRIIGNDGPVNCRSTPGGSRILYTMAPGNGYYFRCYKNGPSVFGNPYVARPRWQECRLIDHRTWDYSTTYGCYVSGYYTDGSCTKGTFDSSDSLVLYRLLRCRTDLHPSETWPVLILKSHWVFAQQNMGNGMEMDCPGV